MNERIFKILHHPLTIPVVTGVVSFGCGVGAGFFLGKQGRKKGELHMLPQPLGLQLDEEDLARIRAEDEIQLEKEVVVFEDNDETHVVDVTEEPEKTIEEILQERRERNARREQEQEEVIEQLPVEEPESEPVPQSVFAESDGDWDYEVELEKRKGERVYMIHEDEFHAQEADFHQTSATFYEGDAILADEDNNPVYNHAQIVGEFKFGHGSSDPNVCFVRNEKRQCEYEILRHTGMFTKEVMHLDIEDNQRTAAKRDLKHSSAPGKFRGD